MAKIQFQDGTFTTREPHEVDTQVAVPENTEVVDHGAVVTTGLPNNHPTAPLGVELVTAKEVVPVTNDAEMTRQTVNPDTMQTDEERDAIKDERKKRAAQRKASARKNKADAAAKKEEEKPPEPVASHPEPRGAGHVGFQMDREGPVPQGRIGFEDAARRDPGRPEHADNDDD